MALRAQTDPTHRDFVLYHKLQNQMKCYAEGYDSEFLSSYLGGAGNTTWKGEGINALWADFDP